MELLKALLLGFVQGATEFLPVSSSGHLVLGANILDFQEQGIAFDVMLHVGTLVSVLIVFRKELAEMASAPFRWLKGERSREVHHFLAWDFYIVIATLPAVVVGLGFKNAIEGLFGSIVTVYLMLIVTGMMMIATRWLVYRSRDINGLNSLLIGCAQACAIVPGLSRSGSTIFMGMFLGIDRETVARFSFIMSIPAILGAAVLNLGDLLATPSAPGNVFNLVAGTLMSAVTGYLAIILLLDIIRRNRLAWFGYYCLAVATIGLALSASI